MAGHIDHTDRGSRFAVGLQSGGKRRSWKNVMKRGRILASEEYT